MQALVQPRLIPIGLVVLLMGLSLPLALASGNELHATVQTCFTPGMNCQALILNRIDQTSANQHIFVQAYSFTSAPLAQALLRAHQRGVKIMILLDRSQLTEQYSSATFFAHAQIPLAIDHQEAIAHNKIMIFPEHALVISGSYNFTRAAETKNAENLLFLSDSPELVTRYLANFTTHWEHSQPYQTR